MLTKLYYSREDRVADLQDGEQYRFNFEDLPSDYEKSDDVTDGLGALVEELAAAQEAYITSIDQPNTEANREAFLHYRAELVYSWAMVQAATSKFAWVHRIDGNKAYETLIGAMEVEATADMRGL